MSFPGPLEGPLAVIKGQRQMWERVDKQIKRIKADRLVVLDALQKASGIEPSS